MLIPMPCCIRKVAKKIRGSKPVSGICPRSLLQFCLQVPALSSWAVSVTCKRKSTHSTPSGFWSLITATKRQISTLGEFIPWLVCLACPVRLHLSFIGGSHPSCKGLTRRTCLPDSACEMSGPLLLQLCNLTEKAGTFQNAGFTEPLSKPTLEKSCKDL